MLDVSILVTILALVTSERMLYRVMLHEMDGQQIVVSLLAYGQQDVRTLHGDMRMVVHVGMGIHEIGMLVLRHSL